MKQRPKIAFDTIDSMSSTPAWLDLFSEDLKSLSLTPTKGPDDFIRLTRVLDNSFDILDNLLTFKSPERFYFKNKKGTFELAGIGEGCLIKGETSKTVGVQLKALWKRDAGIRVFGGMQFDPTTKNTREWAEFDAYRFVVPFIEFCRENNTTKVTLTCPLDGKVDRDAIIERISHQLETANISQPHSSPSPFVPGHDVQIPEKAEWLQIIEKVLAMIHRKEISKIVLARKKILSATKTWSAEWMIRRLAAIKENAFLFLFQPGEGHTFLGRTPERLFQLSENELIVDAIAGTEPRGATSEEDRQYAEALTNSAKEREEHQIVARYVNEKMVHLCTKTQTRVEEQVLKLDKVQHLVTRFCGTPRSGISSFETLLSLHPTPAVGAHPPEASRLISQLEPFERGWYAGPIGWMNQDTAEFAVAIRSALINDKELHIFAGAGIVDQSDPEREWQEIDAKMTNFSFVKGATE